MNYTAIATVEANTTASLKISYQDLRKAFASLSDPRGGPNLQYELASMLIAATADDQGFDNTHFKIDWEAQKVTCPNGKISQNWQERRDHFNNEIVQAKFSRTDCRLCEQRVLCTKSKAEPRVIRLRPRSDHEALQALRQLQTTPEWKTKYDARAGVEGSLSQGVGGFGLRECRYLGLAKNHLQHLATAAAMNIVRLSAWLEGRPHAPTRTSRFASLALAS